MTISHLRAGDHELSNAKISSERTHTVPIGIIALPAKMISNTRFRELPTADAGQADDKPSGLMRYRLNTLQRL